MMLRHQSVIITGINRFAADAGWDIIRALRLNLPDEFILIDIFISSHRPLLSHVPITPMDIDCPMPLEK